VVEISRPTGRLAVSLKFEAIDKREIQRESGMTARSDDFAQLGTVASAPVAGCVAV